MNRFGILRAPAHASADLIPKFTITDPEGTPYLTRWYLFRSKRFRVFLHKFHRSDDDRALHDHPWPFVTILLSGRGYYEHTQRGQRDYYPPFSINFRLNPASPHRVELERDTTGKECPQWTLFIAGINVRRWGFHPAPNQAQGMNLDTQTLAHSDYVPGFFWVPHEVFLSSKFDGVEGATLGLQDD